MIGYEVGCSLAKCGSRDWCVLNEASRLSRAAEEMSDSQGYTSQQSESGRPQREAMCPASCLTSPVLS